MTRAGEYSEKLVSGGSLVVDQQGWCIKYHFYGPDFRYKVEWVTIPSPRVDEYIQAYQHNYEKYEELVQSLPTDGKFETRGECGMTIVVGGYRNDIHITYTHYSCMGNFPIKTRDQLSQVVADYEYAKRRAEEVYKLLFGKS